METIGKDVESKQEVNAEGADDMLMGFVQGEREMEETPDAKVDCFIYSTNRIKISTKEVTNYNNVKAVMRSELPVKLKTPPDVDANKLDKNVFISGWREDFSRIIIRFSLGNETYDLATPDVFARTIQMEIAYKGKEGLECAKYGENGAFVIANSCHEDISFSELQMDFQKIVSDALPGVTWIVIDYVNVFIEDQPYSFTKSLWLEKYFEELKVKIFRATKWTVGRNRITTLFWEIAGAETYTVVIDPGRIMPKKGADEIEVTVDETKNFIISVMDEKGEVKDQKDLMIFVEKQIVDSFTADKCLVNWGEGVNLKWKTSYCERIEITADDGMCAEIPVEQLDEGELKVYPVNDTKYTLKCYGKGETVTRDLSIQVESVQLKDFYIVCGDKKDTALSIKWDEFEKTSPSLNWAAGNASEVKIESNHGYTYCAEPSELESGSVTLGEAQKDRIAEYTITCKGANNSCVTAKVTLTIEDRVDITVFKVFTVLNYIIYYIWETVNATVVSVAVDGKETSEKSSGGGSFKMEAGRKYTVSITADGAGGRISRSKTVEW